MGARSQSNAEQLFSGGSEMAALMREVDWTRTPLGPVRRWPHSLRTALRIALNSRYPMFVWWGPELTNLYNDAYIPVLGGRHPQALGRAAREVWAEIWHVVGPQAEAVFKHKQATWNEELLLVMERHGYPEETYFTFSYSPIPSDNDKVVGLFCACNEETGRVIAQRRLRTLRELAAGTLGAKTVEEVCALAARALGNSSHDLPFALVYLLSEDGKRARLATAAGLQTGTAASPYEVELAGARSVNDVWGFGEVLARGASRLLDDLGARFEPLPGGPWSKSPRSAVVLPIPNYGQRQPAGFLVVGISPVRPFDDEYRRFCELVAGQVATAISDARAYEAERRRADALAELDRAKTAFFSNVSHEFRTPLTLMLGPIEDLKSQFGKLDSAISTPQYQQLDLLHRNALRLTKLVNTLLDFSRIETGRTEAVYEPTDLAALTSELASAFRSAMEQAGLELIVDCPPLPEPAYVDREMWEKIVLNLLSNAFKFTFEGKIEVKLALRDSRVELVVRDTGIGVPEDQVPRLFERFHRVPGAQGRTQEGTGTGLALTQELARLHGGSVSVESQYGEGSTVTVAMPLGNAHLGKEPIGGARVLASTATRARAYVEEALRWLPDAGPEVSDAEIPDYLGEMRGVARDEKRPRLLVADDNADMRDYLRRLLSCRYEVELARDGEAVLETARTAPPDLVLADVMMPRLDGLGLLAQLRADPQTAAIPVILVSARAGEEARIQGLDAGADDYLVKPFSARELLARVSAHLQIASIRRKAEQAVRELNKTLEQRVAARTAELRKLASELANAEQRERRRLSSILHNDLQQLLMGARLRLASAVRHAGPAAPEVRRVEELTAEALKLCRSLSVELTPPVLSQEGVLPTLQWAAERAREQYGLETEVTATGADPDLPEDKKALLLTVVQELLLNVVKHSGANRTRIKFDSTSKGVIEVQVEDEGAGCDWQGGPTSGFGLFNIRERLQWLGGTLTLSSQPNRGTRAIVRLPFVAGEDGAVNAILQRKARAANPIRILLADDHNMVRDGLKSFIQAENDMEVIGEASDGAQAIELARDRHPDVIVIDVNMPRVNGIEATRAIKRELPHVKVIAVSVDEQQQRTVDAMRDAGACEFVTKEMAAETLCQLIRRQMPAAA